jgi:hypothetical protein
VHQWATLWVKRWRAVSLWYRNRVLDRTPIVMPAKAGIHDLSLCGKQSRGYRPSSALRENRADESIIRRPNIHAMRQRVR